MLGLLKAMAKSARQRTDPARRLPHTAPLGANIRFGVGAIAKADKMVGGGGVWSVGAGVGRGHDQVGAGRGPGEGLCKEGGGKQVLNVMVLFSVYIGTGRLVLVVCASLPA